MNFACFILTIWLVLFTIVPEIASAQSVEQTSLNSLIALGEDAIVNGERFQALRAFAEAHRLYPENEIAAKRLSDVLVDLGAIYGAAAVLDKNSDIGIRSKKAAIRVRWGRIVRPREYAHRFDSTDRALAELDALIKEAALLSPPDPGLVARLHGDRIVALRDRERWSEVIVATEYLRSLGAVIPPYVRFAEAEALLTQRRPKEAQIAYQDLLAVDPHDRSSKVGLFFAQVESEDYSGAFATVDGLASEGASHEKVGRNAVPQPNADWLDAQMLAALARSYAEMHSDAWNRIRQLALKAPGNSTLHSVKSEIAAARGWARFAEEELKIAESLDPNDFGIKVNAVNSDMRRGRWRKGQAELENLLKIAPENSAVMRTLKDLNAHNMGQLELAVQARDESGVSGNAPGGGTDAATKIYSRPFAENYRIIASSMYSDSTPPQEGYLQRIAVGGGLKGEWTDWETEVLAWQNTGELTRAGGLLRTSWQPTDRLVLHGAFELFSWDTPLRAIKHEIYGNAAGGSVTWAWNESLAASARFRLMDFSDDNNRTEESFDMYLKAIDIPHFDLNFRPAIYTSQNSERDAPYYSPVNDLSLTLTVEAEHVWWRHYEESFNHRLVLSAGSYAQHGFDTGVIGSATYEQNYSFAPRTDVTYGLRWSYARYDGDPERTVTGFLRVNQRF